MGGDSFLFHAKRMSSVKSQVFLSGPAASLVLTLSRVSAASEIPGVDTDVRGHSLLLSLIWQQCSCFSNLWCSGCLATHLSCCWSWGPASIPADVSALPPWYQLSSLALAMWYLLAASLERRASLSPCPRRVLCWFSSELGPPIEWSSLFSCDQRLIK